MESGPRDPGIRGSGYRELGDPGNRETEEPRRIVGPGIRKSDDPGSGDPGIRASGNPGIPGPGTQGPGEPGIRGIEENCGSGDPGNR